jgi:hypothetical protein
MDEVEMIDCCRFEGGSFNKFPSISNMMKNLPFKFAALRFATQFP